MHVDAIVGQCRRRAVGPLDHRDAATLERLLPPGRPEVLPLEPVQVEVEEWQAATVVLVKDDERRARDRALVEAETRGDALREDGLPRSELAPEREHVTGLRQARETLPDALGVQGGMADEVDGLGA